MTSSFEAFSDFIFLIVFPWAVTFSHNERSPLAPLEAAVAAGAAGDAVPAGFLLASYSEPVAALYRVVKWARNLIVLFAKVAKIAIFYLKKSGDNQFRLTFQKNCSSI